MASWVDADRPLDRSARWMTTDVVLAALLVWVTVVSVTSDAYVDEFGAITGAGWLLALSPSCLVPMRRLAPLAALVVASALYFAISVGQGDSNAPLAAPFFAYAVGVSRPIRRSAPIVAAAALTLTMGTLLGPGEADPLTAIVWFLLLGSGWLVAVSIRRNQTRADRLQQNVEQLEIDQAEIAHQARADERARIAHELHDAVGHAVNVIVLQAGAARLAGDPARALDATEQIERIGRSALVDLDHLLGLMQPTGDEPARAPTRTSRDIVTLVDELRASGVDVELDDQCDCDLDWRTSAASYRIAQESLTNALKHAPGAAIVVTMSCSPTELHLSIVDGGGAVTDGPPAVGGRGIPGMVERAEILGGHLVARPRPAGGFVVDAVLPTTPTSDSEACGRARAAPS